jgi:hypothetical protein
MAILNGGGSQGTNLVAGTTYAFSITTSGITSDPSRLVVIALGYDNGGTQGADPYSSISDNGGNTWTSRFNGLNDPGAANAGSTLRIFTATIPPNTTVTITVTFTVSITAKSYLFQQFYSSLGYNINFLSASAATIGSTTTIASNAVSVNNGDAIFAAFAIEGTSTGTAGDGDTTNGSWSLGQISSGGTGTSVISTYSQYKIVNATGNQTWNVTGGAAGDWVAGTINITETVTASLDPMGRMGFFGL